MVDEDKTVGKGEDIEGEEQHDQPEGDISDQQEQQAPTYATFLTIAT